MQVHGNWYIQRKDLLELCAAAHLIRIHVHMSPLHWDVMLPFHFTRRRHFAVRPYAWPRVADGFNLLELCTYIVALVHTVLEIQQLRGWLHCYKTDLQRWVKKNFRGGNLMGGWHLAFENATSRLQTCVKHQPLSILILFYLYYKRANELKI
jgi:hypothetical protein